MGSLGTNRTTACLRSLAVVLLLLVFLSSLSLPVQAGQTFDLSLAEEKIQLGCSYLQSLYNPALQLVRETSGSNTYHIASDNLLAQRALLACHNAIYDSTSAAIRQSISISSCCGTGADLMHEILLGSTVSLPLHTANNYVIANSTAGRLFRGVGPIAAGGNYTVVWEVHNATSVFTDCTYADVAAYTFIERHREGNNTGEQQQIACLNMMFDGKGMIDEPYKDGTTAEHGIYQTFKTALYLQTFAYQCRQIPISLEESILRVQGPEGGFHTGYDQAGTYAGTLENAETTSIVLIVLASITPTPICLPFLGWIFYVWIGLAAAASIVVGLVLLFENQRKRNLKV